uniref:CS domain-containing protein n=1 Tax=Syphacia muris TaxID=451379 RepID=A0A0N5AUY6_9BILA
MAAATKLHPLVQWAQREKVLFLTIEIDKITELNVTEKELQVKGNYSGSSAEYEAKIEFYADVKTEYRRIPGDRHLELVLDKEASGWWPRLLKNASKVPWVKVDFNKWKDEDEDEDEDGDLSNNFDFKNYMANMGGDAGEVPNLGDFEDEDDDDEDMPELEDADADKKVDDKKKDTTDDKTKTKPVEEDGKSTNPDQKTS